MTTRADRILALCARVRRAESELNDAARALRKACEASAGLYQCARPAVQLIMSKVAFAFNQSPSSMTTRIRTAQVAEARMVAMYLCRELTGFSHQVLGDCFLRDHGSIIHACHAIGGRMAPNHAGPEAAEFRAKVNALRETLADQLKQIDLPIFADQPANPDL